MQAKLRTNSACRAACKLPAAAPTEVETVPDHATAPFRICRQAGINGYFAVIVIRISADYALKGAT